MNHLNAKDIKSVFVALHKVMDENKNYLINIDAKVGDGDLGITMQKGFKAADEQLQVCDNTNIGFLLSKAGMAIAMEAPSTMGTLVGTGFMKAGKALKTKEEINLSDLAGALEEFVDGIMIRGKAKPGDKTIIDSLLPAAKSLKSSANEGKTLEEAIQIAYDASLNGLEATKTMTPQHGKQVAHREKSLGLQDPGATVGMLIIRTITNHILGNTYSQ